MREQDSAYLELMEVLRAVEKLNRGGRLAWPTADVEACRLKITEMKPFLLAQEPAHGQVEQAIKNLKPLGRQVWELLAAAGEASVPKTHL